MYIGIDIGGTKTLIASLNNDGVIEERIKIPTPKKYEDLLSALKKTIAGLKTSYFKAGGLAIPASRIDRSLGVGEVYSNLPWRDTPIQHDVEEILKCPLVIENDAKLAALSESMLLKGQYKVVLYVTVSTGIGYGLVRDGQIDKNVGDGGGRTILLEHEGKMMPWEDFASGRAIVERYGKRAEDIYDEDTWRRISNDLAQGFIELIAVTEPEVIVVGGGVGNYFERFKKFLDEDIKSYKVPLIKMPVLMKAQRPDDAVVYGCYDLAKQFYPHA